MWQALWLITFAHVVVLYLCDSSSLNVDAMVVGRFWMNLKAMLMDDGSKKKLGKARNWAIAGVAFSAVCRCLGAASGVLLFNNPNRQCTGNPALNYSDAYLNSLPTAINLTTGDSLFTHEQVIAICPVLSTVEILYWMNILLNCWFGIITSKQILSKTGVLSYAIANAFTAISYFVVLLDLSSKHDVWWFAYAAYFYLPYMVASAIVLFASMTSQGGKNAIAIPSDIHYLRWAMSLVGGDKSR